MKFSIERNALRDALAAVAAAVAGKTTLPILGNVLMTAVDGKVGFNATDLDTAVSVSAPGEVEAPGELTLPAKRLLEIAKQLPEGIVRFSADKGQAVIAGKARYSLPTMPTEEFPAFPTVDFAGAMTTAPGAIQRMIAGVSFAASNDVNRPIMSGVEWQLRPASMRMVATNGHRLALMEVAATGGTTRDLIVPTKALGLVRKLFAAEAGIDVAVSKTGGHVGFRSGDTVLLSRLIEGPFPGYARLFPKDNARSVTLDREAFIAALRRVAIVASDQTHSVRLSGSAEFFRIATQTPDTGEAYEVVAAAWEGEALEVGVSAEYLIETLENVPTTEVRMTFKDAARVMTVDPVGSDDPARWTALLMPLRLVA
jgi:DNA polymerase-3 subunit beta